MEPDKLIYRHIGPRKEEIAKMLKTIGVSTLDELIDKTIPSSIRLDKPLDLPVGLSEYEYLKTIKEIASANRVYRTYIGLGYYGTKLPSVIQRNILENPGWYTSYTPYQAEISQGRLEALLNFQTVIMDLTGMEIANASLLDEATAAAEAMTMLFNARKRAVVKQGVVKFFVDENIFPQTLDVLKTRSAPLGIELIQGKYDEFEFGEKVFGAFIQYPGADGEIEDFRAFTGKAHESDIAVAVAADIMSLVILTPPGEWGADVVVGSTQRFGIPLGYGGPHAGYFATKEDFKRYVPGRIIGVSRDALGNHALRMALQTREQHIKREKATSNICTAQALLATMAGMYAVYNGPAGLRQIAGNIHRNAGYLEQNLNELGYRQLNANFFDTLKIELPDDICSDDIEKIALGKEINLRYIDNKTIGISVDEITSKDDLRDILYIFSEVAGKPQINLDNVPEKNCFDEKFDRKTDFLTLDVFNRYQSETEMMRYIKKLERRDLSLTHSMISLGSCTMKLNAATEMFPITWPEFANLHPFIPADQARGYHRLFTELEDDLKKITGFEAITFQPNSGAAGEFTGMILIREYHKSRGEEQRNVVLIPASAHGTNPASAVMAGMKVIVVDCDEKGNVDINNLRETATANAENLAGFMITYPSTHGVFEEEIIEMINIVHDHGGQVYLDGANLNALMGLTNLAIIGADVCHLNLHKTFAVPHGGGGPGVGPIGVAKHLVEFLPGHPLVKTGGKKGISAVAASPWGSPSILPISYGYIKMMGGEGLTMSSKIAILNANYIAASLRGKYRILYTGKNGFVAHEMIIECRNFKEKSGITVSDIAKRLMDYGFHAPTLSFPVHGTLMVEPTESESYRELNRFIESMLGILEEITEIEENRSDIEDNVLKNAPHTQKAVVSDSWVHSYGREQAAFPLKWVMENKFWPAVSRVDDAFGDRNLVCSCAPINDYM
ncbi:MAG: aminomethyl-transferring glycine dehydrogenase [Bacteroidetes bacterium]|nr:aminomethyl-transferring glycine dehydrogenase [Bacteroidota bacterium]